MSDIKDESKYKTGDLVLYCKAFNSVVCGYVYGYRKDYDTYLYLVIPPDIVDGKMSFQLENLVVQKEDDLYPMEVMTDVREQFMEWVKKVEKTGGLNG